MYVHTYMKLCAFPHVVRGMSPSHIQLTIQLVIEIIFSSTKINCVRDTIIVACHMLPKVGVLRLL